MIFRPESKHFVASSSLNRCLPTLAKGNRPRRCFKSSLHLSFHSYITYSKVCFPVLVCAVIIVQYLFFCAFILILTTVSQYWSLRVRLGFFVYLFESVSWFTCFVLSFDSSSWVWRLFLDCNVLDSCNADVCDIRVEACVISLNLSFCN